MAKMTVEQALATVPDKSPDGAWMAMLEELTGLDAGVISAVLAGGDDPNAARQKTANKKRADRRKRARKRKAVGVAEVLDLVGIAIAAVEVDAEAHGLTGQMLGARDCLRAVAALRERVLVGGQSNNAISAITAQVGE